MKNKKERQDEALQPIFFDQNTKYLVVYTVILQTRHVRGERVREPHLRF